MKLKKPVKITLIVLGSLVVLYFVALLVAPKIARSYIEEHSKEMIGRSITIKDISLNPFTYVLDVDTLAILEADDKTKFVAFDKFSMNINPLKLITRTLDISDIYMKALYVRTTQHGERFNFSDILEFLAQKDSIYYAEHPEEKKAQDNESKSAAEIAAGLPVKLSLRNIVFEKGNIIYQDIKVGSKFHLKDFSINIPAIYLEDNATGVDVSLKFADGGDLSVKVDANMATYDFNIYLNLHRFALACIKPYLNDSITYKDFSGFLSANITISGNINSILSSNVKGKVILDKIDLTEKSGSKMGAENVTVGIGKANLTDNEYLIDSVIVDGAFAHIDLYKDGKTNFDVLLTPMNKGAAKVTDSTATTDSTVTAEAAPKAEPKPEPKAEPKAEPVADTTSKATSDTTSVAKAADQKPAKAKKLKAKINKLLVKNTYITITDHTIIRPFNYKVSAITVTGQNINYDTPCNVNVAASFPEGGSLSLKYHGALSNLNTMDIYISVKNLVLKHFSNYSLHYTAYPIKAGTLAFASENKIVERNLDSKNTIDIYNITVGNKVDDIDPEYTVPMKIGLYILKDKDDKIQFDVPVKGNLDDPEFSYGKIIWKTVVNLLVKVAVSPFRLVGNLAMAGASALGFDLGKNDEVLIDANTETFTSEQYAKAIKMTEMIQKDPNLMLTFTQYYNPRKTAKEYKVKQLKIDFYKQKNNKTELNELDYRAIEEIKDKDKEFQAYVKEHSAEIDKNYMMKVLPQMASKRNADLLKVLRAQPGITKKNLKVITAPRDALRNYKDKPMYKVTVDVQ
ncbi:DUF748 domain-containing protein [Fibrobacter sp. UWB12]|uniref:DUF748 domain-containing protein n=1 Tax=Fibrobacter sp. UWB12 TaxID=1896203 RepID=UPI0009143A75|nr:DUF748 domain-containing protein [Fibrobacter sp. UWB12]SHK59858.1 protein of unknown function [Fibrobacter sp. UWB12]